MGTIWKILKQTGNHQHKKQLFIKVGEASNGYLLSCEVNIHLSPHPFWWTVVSDYTKTVIFLIADKKLIYCIIQRQSTGISYISDLFYVEENGFLSYDCLFQKFKTQPHIVLFLLFLLPKKKKKKMQSSTWKTPLFGKFILSHRGQLLVCKKWPAQLLKISYITYNLTSI